MADEQNYRSHLLSPEEAFERLGPSSSHGYLARIAWGLWEQTVQIREERAARARSKVGGEPESNSGGESEEEPPSSSDE
jgi:hypothetical protein